MYFCNNNYVNNCIYMLIAGCRLLYIIGSTLRFFFELFWTVALIFLCLMLLEFPHSLRVSGAFYAFFPVQQMRETCQKFPWSNPTPSLITANQNSLSLSRVLMLSVTDQSALGHSRFILAIESSKDFGRLIV